MWKLSKPGNLVLDASAKTLSKAKAFLMLHKHRSFVGCERVSRCVEKSPAGLVEGYASQLLNGQSDLKGGDDLIGSWASVPARCKSQILKESLNIWGHDMLSGIYRRLKNTWCCTSGLGLRISQLSTYHSCPFALALLKCGEGGRKARIWKGR